MAQSQKLLIGQTVRLKSDGPEMTVQAENTNMHNEIISYSCQWFAGKKLESGRFPPDSLQIIDQQSK